MKLLWACFIVFLVTCAVESLEKRSPKIRPHGDGRTKVAPVTPTSPPCICTLEFNPVCGSDGKTYGNDCALMCAQKDDPDLTKAYEGECETPQCPPNPSCGCTREYKPVCGSDGQTYGNICTFCCYHMTNPDLKYVHPGECYEA